MAPSTSLRSEGELFRKILGDEWLRLHPDIQKRFEKNPLPGEPLSYHGNLEELWCSKWGRMLAWLTRPIVGGALMPFVAKDLPVDIQVYCEKGCPYIFKRRFYKFPNRKTIAFTSYMKESEKGEVLEYVGGGLGMKLIVFEKDTNLHFRSDGYFWDMKFFRLPLPDILSPGRTYLAHVNEGENQFRIRIDIDHIIFGKMFVQAGVFHERRT